MLRKREPRESSPKGPGHEDTQEARSAKRARSAPMRTFMIGNVAFEATEEEIGRAVLPDHYRAFRVRALRAKNSRPSWHNSGTAMVHIDDEAACMALLGNRGVKVRGRSMQITEIDNSEPTACVRNVPTEWNDQRVGGMFNPGSVRGLRRTTGKYMNNVKTFTWFVDLVSSAALIEALVGSYPPDIMVNLATKRRAPSLGTPPLGRGAAVQSTFTAPPPPGHIPPPPPPFSPSRKPDTFVSPRRGSLSPPRNGHGSQSRNNRGSTPVGYAAHAGHGGFQNDGSSPRGLRNGDTDYRRSPSASPRRSGYRRPSSTRMELNGSDHRDGRARGNRDDGPRSNGSPWNDAGSRGHSEDGHRRFVDRDEREDRSHREYRGPADGAWDHGRRDVDSQSQYPREHRRSARIGVEAREKLHDILRDAEDFYFNDFHSGLCCRCSNLPFFTGDPVEQEKKIRTVLTRDHGFAVRFVKLFGRKRTSAVVKFEDEGPVDGIADTGLKFMLGSRECSMAPFLSDSFVMCKTVNEDTVENLRHLCRTPNIFKPKSRSERVLVVSRDNLAVLKLMAVDGYQMDDMPLNVLLVGELCKEAGQGKRDEKNDRDREAHHSRTPHDGGRDETTLSRPRSEHGEGLRFHNDRSPAKRGLMTGSPGRESKDRAYDSRGLRGVHNGTLGKGITPKWRVELRADRDIRIVQGDDKTYVLEGEGVVDYCLLSS